MFNKASSSTTEQIKNQSKKLKLEISERVRVLCLHGYRQNGDSFKSKLGSLRKQVSKYADFVFISAPHVAEQLDKPEENGSNMIVEKDQLSWWFNSEDGKTFKATNRNAVAYKFEESVRFVENIWMAEGPFQGLLGFSQGACFVGLIAGLAKMHMTKIRPNFVILSSGFISGSLAHVNYFDEPIEIPSLHIFGESDDIVTPQMSKALAKHFEHCEILTHPGGHYFPATAVQKPIYLNFFQDRLQDYLEEKELSRMKAEGLLKFEVSDNSDISENNFPDAEDSDES
ncbi:esterase GA18864 [Condylostylus longicornis]|uniref:esterase GA18864 n=1 Tax=Condylostylus longicornis TaxID=2530218 RepID=UPI00244E4138|nr:esterase GA18864 [Condylostylus longicornis]